VLLLVALALAIVWQTILLVHLHTRNRELKTVLENSKETISKVLEVEELKRDVAELQKLKDDNVELRRLQAEAAEFQKTFQNADQLAAEYKRLARQMQDMEANTSALSDEEFFRKADDKKRRFECMSNLRKITMAAVMWAHDNKSPFPSDYQSMKKYLTDLGVLVCPSDTSRIPAADWNIFGPANVSYQILSPGIPSSYQQVPPGAAQPDSDAVYVRCPIHGSVGLVDGSAHQLGPQLHVAQKDGHWKVIRNDE
jgi:hypothetical protein